MDLTSLDYAWYIPEAYGNRAKWLAGEEARPFQVEVRTPAFGYMRKLSQRGTMSPAEKQAVDRAHFVQHIRGVKDLVLDGTAVVTSDDLWRLGAEENKLDPELFIELFRVLDDKAKLREGLAAGLPGPSGSA